MLRRGIGLSRCALSANTINFRVINRQYWQQVKDKDGQMYYVHTDTFEKTTEKPFEYVPFEAMESKLVRILKSDNWSDPLKPVPKWKNYLGYALFGSCMAYLVGMIIYKNNENKKAAEKEKLLQEERRKKIEALKLVASRSNN